MFFKRKVYEELLVWKKEYADRYSALLEGVRRVGKSTIAEEFAKNEYRSYVLIDFVNVSYEVRSCFDDIATLDLLFLWLQGVTGKQSARERKQTGRDAEVSELADELD